MKKTLTVNLFVMLLLTFFGGCSSEQAGNQSAESNSNNAVVETMQDEEHTDIPVETLNIPQELVVIPESYYSPASQQGTLVELYYDTYESVTYEEKMQTLNKRAIVYLPYDYSEEEKYNVFYLMHGGWGNETTQLGTPAQPSALKNVIDNGIANGDFEPLLIVCPTYNNTSPEDSANYSLAFGTLTVNYHNELVNDLIPAVEEKYSTYAESTSAEDIAASRDHRAFGGFSMGSVTTWYTFVNCLDQFRYFLPMSGAMDYQGDDVDVAVTASGHAPEDFFIFAITGTDDFEYRNFTNQMEGMLSMESGNFVEGENVAFRVKEGYAHDGRAAMEYTYNGLLQFWKKEATQMQYTQDSKIADVIADPSFGEYGRLIFPVDESYYSGDTLKDLRLTWYSNIDPDKTVEVVNYMKTHADAGDIIFYDIYSDEEKKADPAKEDTGLFFFKGNQVPDLQFVMQAVVLLM